METYKLTFQTIPFSVWAAFPLKRFVLPLLEQSHVPPSSLASFTPITERHADGNGAHFGYSGGFVVGPLCKSGKQERNSLISCIPQRLDDDADRNLHPAMISLKGVQVFKQKGDRIVGLV